MPFTTVRKFCLVEQLASSTAEGGRMHESVHGKFLLAELEFKKKLK